MGKINATPEELANAAWRKSRRSTNGGDCLEVADLPDVDGTGKRVAVRDSKDRSGPVLTFTRSEWAAFTGGVKDGEFG